MAETKSFSRLVDGQINFPGTAVKLTIHLDLAYDGSFNWFMVQPGNGGTGYLLPIDGRESFHELRQAMEYVRRVYPEFKVTSSMLEGIKVEGPSIPGTDLLTSFGRHFLETKELHAHAESKDRHPLPTL